jgi:hypothetical protein
MSVGIIGGADGPTAILVKGGFPIAFIAAAAVLIVIAAIWIGAAADKKKGPGCPRVSLRASAHTDAAICGQPGLSLCEFYV